jgi:3-hydroxyacyl-[acyl-carrier protein] dehydratase/trans-2-decenoyl-[acyl-carrier protein] isomerase
VRPNLKTSYDKREILAFCVHDPNLPRRLPAPPLLMFDRIPEIHTDGGKHGLGWLLAEKDVHIDDWFFFCHFEGDPVMPGMLEVDAILQLTGFFLHHAGFGGYGRALRTAKTTFREQVRPHHKLVSYRIDLRRITDRPTPLASAEGVALVDGQVSAEVEGIMVGLFPDLSYSFP